MPQKDELAVRRQLQADLHAIATASPTLCAPEAQLRLSDYIGQHRETGESTMPPKGYHSLGEDLINVAMRLPQSVLDQVDAHVDWLREQHPAFKIGRSDALRDLVQRGLTALHPAVDTPRQRANTGSVTQIPPPTTPQQAPQDLAPDSPGVPSYDSAKDVLGKLCPRKHDYQGTGQTLLRLPQRVCRLCENEVKRERRQATHHGG